MLREMLRDVLGAASPALLAAGGGGGGSGGGGGDGDGGDGSACTAMQLLGGDVVCDASGRPYLIELNPSPQLKYTTLAAGSRSRQQISNPNLNPDSNPKPNPSPKTHRNPITLTRTL